jgi:exopolyphosphatase
MQRRDDMDWGGSNPTTTPPTETTTLLSASVTMPRFSYSLDVKHQTQHPQHQTQQQPTRLPPFAVYDTPTITNSHHEHYQTNNQQKDCCDRKHSIMTMMRTMMMTTTVMIIVLTVMTATMVTIADVVEVATHHETSQPLVVLLPTATLSSSLASTSSRSHNNEYLRNVTFGELARTLLPSYYNSMLVSIHTTFSPTVQPGSVYVVRKQILKTRDLVDIFSPIYPNTTTTGEKDDIWHLLRCYLDQGYEVVGEFLDLNHTHVRYTPQQAAYARNKVLEWNKNFTAFRQTYDIPAFLESPTVLHGSFYHEQESRLFWKDGAPQNSKRPKGNDSATASLHMLGVKQLQKGQHYLQEALQHKHGINETIHEEYHNLRKVLRSLCDEYELLGSVMFPSSPLTDSAIKVFQKARKLLGDMNDDWTALEFYNMQDKFPQKQKKFVQQVNRQWKHFKLWARTSDFEDSFQYLLQCMRPAIPKISVNSFLQQQEQQQQRRRSGLHSIRSIILGNVAGDADSVVSAITLAYVEASLQPNNQPKTPIVSIPRHDLETQRPETSYLLKLAGVELQHLLCIDEYDAVINTANDTGGAVNVTLVDHNVLDDGSLQIGNTNWNWNWTVVEIMDHHQDEEHHLDTCPLGSTARTIAFANGQALVASTTTLVAERLRELGNTSNCYPASLSLLLLGVILLDSVNLSPQVGKVTQRDQNAVEDLLHHTCWYELPRNVQKVLQMTTANKMYILPNATALFCALQEAKYNPKFWRSLSVPDALRQDYKAYSSSSSRGGVGTSNGTTTIDLGVSTVLMPLTEFLAKRNIMSGINQYMNSVNVNFLGIMLAYEENGCLYRQLVLCCKGPNNHALLDHVVNELLLTNRANNVTLLQLEEIHLGSLQSGDDNSLLYLRAFHQHNVQSSRKQIGPLLQQVYSTCCNGGE